MPAKTSPSQRTKPPMRRIVLEQALRSLRLNQHMGPLVRRHGRPIYRKPSSSFAALGRAILYQQLTGKAAGTILSRFSARYPKGRFPRPEEVLALEERDFVASGVSRQKRGYLIDLATHFASGSLNPRRFRHQSDDDLLQDLCRVKGIGIWTVQMFQISSLHRPDVMPTGDLGIQKGIQKLYALDKRPAPAEMEELSQPWRPWRSVACHYLWRHVDIDEP